MNELDKMAIELTKSFKKVSLPPKLKYKVKKWLQSVSPQTPDKQMDRRRVMETAKTELTRALLHHIDARPLAKNEIMASQYDNGALRFDFGSDVPDQVKHAAMVWAKKRGLNPVEASMNKNQGSMEEYLVCGARPDENSCSQEIIRLSV